MIAPMSLTQIFALSVLTDIFSVFSEISDWIMETIPKMYPLFWDSAANTGAGGLTFLGVLAVCGLGMSVVFLLLSVIQNFLHWRG